MINSVLIGTSEDTLREAFGRAICDLASKRDELVLLDADIAGGTGAHHFRSEFPKRFLQMGIAEQNMMSVAAGISDMGLTPIVTTFAIFCIRAVEQARLSIAYNNRNVKIFASHPGLDVGPDGASAQCLEDLAIFRSIPNFTVISPADPLEMALATEAAVSNYGPFYIRTGRSKTESFLPSDHKFVIGKGQILRAGSDVAIICCGKQTFRSLKAADSLEKIGISVTVVNMPTIKPIDGFLLESIASSHKGLIVTEDHNIFGGLFGAVSEYLATNRPTKIVPVCVRDKFGESGEPEELAQKYEIDTNSIIKAVVKLLEIHQ